MQVTNTLKNNKDFSFQLQTLKKKLICLEFITFPDCDITNFLGNSWPAKFSSQLSNIHDGNVSISSQIAEKLDEFSRI